MLTIKVPATSANLGPGFDSIGLALDLYLTLKVKGPQDHWQIEHTLGADVPSDEHNLILKTALALIPDLTPRRIIMTSDIPLARGLGSSSSAIIAGIELANQLGDLGLSDYDKLQIAVRLEGHPDNVAPAIYGGFVVATYDDMVADAISAPVEHVHALTYIHNEELLTSESRAVLPKQVPLAEAVQTSSASNVLVAAVLRGQLDVAFRMMERDHFHETYRQDLVPHLAKIREAAHACDVYGTYLSGAGPTVITLVSEVQATATFQQLTRLDLPGKWLNLGVARQGMIVTN